MNGENSIWIQTYQGGTFHPLSPLASEVDIRDIAHALSLKCRFTGHCQEFYSVAQHSVLVSLIVPPEDALWGLMHDSAEAYLPDVAKPYKHLVHFKVDRLWKTFDDIERAILEAVATKLTLPLFMSDSIKEADRILLATEARDLMASPPMTWRHTVGVSPLDRRIIPLSPKMAERMFLARWNELRHVTIDDKAMLSLAAVSADEHSNLGTM